MEMLTMPAHIDEPKQYLLWSVDEIVPIGLMMGVGVILSQLFFCLCAGFVAASLYRRYKESQPEGYSEHLMYWYGLLPNETRTWPSPFRNKFYG